jgi:hypothetical protein
MPKKTTKRVTRRPAGKDTTTFPIKRPALRSGIVKTDLRLPTSGRGRWSLCVTDGVHITGMALAYVTASHGGDFDYGELRVYFDKKTWNTNERGLIYTDPGFLKALRRALVDMGFSEKAAKDVQYSEQGMQGDNYVSLDVFKRFVPEWLRKHGATKSAMHSPSKSYTKLARANREQRMKHKSKPTKPRSIKR